MQASSVPLEPEALQSKMDDTFGAPQTSCIFTSSDTMDFCTRPNVSQELQPHNPQFNPPGNSMPVACTTAENSTHLRASLSSLPDRTKEPSSSGRQLALSIDGSTFPSPTAAFFDDFLEVESSLQALAADEGSQLSDDFCTSSNGDTLRSSRENFSAKGKPGSGLKQLKNTTTGNRLHYLTFSYFLNYTIVGQIVLLKFAFTFYLRAFTGLYQQEPVTSSGEVHIL